ncbi:MAG: hypothetical protein K2P70_19015 [Hyphomonadaceae bacterium]|nr:hypothetical protein [Hyphomonadaceae bacterium]
MRALIAVIALCTAACASTTPVGGESMARSSSPTPEHVAGPDTIDVRHLFWGRTIHGWSITRGGAGRYTDERGVHELQVPIEAFDRILQVMSPWRQSGVQCSNAPTDGPYGEIEFVMNGERTRSGWRLGCDAPNAEDLYRRLNEADHIARGLISSPIVEPLPCSNQEFVVTFEDGGPTLDESSSSYVARTLNRARECNVESVTVTFADLAQGEAVRDNMIGQGLPLELIRMVDLTTPSSRTAAQEVRVAIAFR